MGFQWLDTFHVGCTPSPSEEARDFCKSLAPGSLLPVLLWSSGGKVEAGFFVRTAVFFWKRLGDCKTGRRPRGLMLTIFPFRSRTFKNIEPTEYAFPAPAATSQVSSRSPFVAGNLVHVALAHLGLSAGPQSSESAKSKSAKRGKRSACGEAWDAPVGAETGGCSKK